MERLPRTHITLARTRAKPRRQRIRAIVVEYGSLIFSDSKEAMRLYNAVAHFPIPILHLYTPVSVCMMYNVCIILHLYTPVSVCMMYNVCIILHLYTPVSVCMMYNVCIILHLYTPVLHTSLQKVPH